jgi:cell division ATPase FtsA
MVFQDLFSIFRKAEYEAIVDVGTEAVKAVGFKRGAGRLSSVGFAKEYYTPHDVSHQGFAEVFDAGRVIEKTIKKACNGFSPAMCEVILGPLFVTPYLAHKKFIRHDPDALITKEEEENMQKDLEKVCLDIYVSEYRALSGEEKPTFLENVFQDWTVDGYEGGGGIVGRKGTSVEGTVLRMCTSSSKMRILEKLFQGIPEESLKFSYEFSYVFDCIKRISPDHRTVLCIDIGGRVTSFFLVQEGKLKEVHSRGFGGHDISEHAAGVLGVGFFEAEQLKITYASKVSPSHAGAVIADIAAPLWSKFFDELFDTISSWYENESPHLISDILFMGGGATGFDIGEICKDAIARQKRFPSLESIRIETVSPASFLSNTLYKEIQTLFTGPQDTMCVLALTKRVKPLI